MHGSLGCGKVLGRLGRLSYNGYCLISHPFQSALLVQACRQSSFMISLHKLDSSNHFPHPNEALNEPNGLLAFGGDLSASRLLCAYQNGIFPWFSEGEPILWWSPDPRGVLFTDQYKPSKSLKKYLRKSNLRVTTDYVFDAVIEECANAPRKDNGTWITSDMVNAYKALHRQGDAHSVEVWRDDSLVGGLYGVFVNNIFCGESMFSKESNASKVAFHLLVQWLKNRGVKMIDCQLQNPHLQSLGCITIPRSEFLTIIKANQDKNPSFVWKPSELER